MLMWKKPKLAVDVLLARLEAITKDKNDADELSSEFEDFKMELERMGNVFPDIKSLEKTILDKFSDPKMKSKVKKTLNHMKDVFKELREIAPSVDNNVGTNDIDDHQMVCREWVDLGVENELLNSEMSNLSRSFPCLSGSRAKMCSLCLSVFPQKSIIEKRPLIYWWMGEGLVMKSLGKTAEEVGEQVFQELLDEGFIRPSSENKSLSVSSFVIDPWIHRMLILIAKENSYLKFNSHGTLCDGERRAFLCKEEIERTDTDTFTNVVMVFNVNEQFVKPVWLSNLRKVEVLQMGRWQTCFTDHHNKVVDHHIEVADQTLLNGLGSQEHLKYLSLRGISRIETLPDSISKLISLQILDLRACHNLEKLPPGVSKLKNLTHLDVSQCYLLESMPKGLERLVALQVLKGFVIGKGEKNSCKISDLKPLKELRKLSIRVGNGQQDNQLSGLGGLSALSILTISWGASSVSNEGSVSLPENLRKLDLRCVPFEEVPSWLKPPGLERGGNEPRKKPSSLVKLYIIGGKLKTLGPEIIEGWKVEFLRLKYLDDLKMNEGEWANHGYLDKTRS